MDGRKASNLIKPSKDSSSKMFDAMQEFFEILERASAFFTSTPEEARHEIGIEWSKPLLHAVENVNTTIHYSLNPSTRLRGLIESLGSRQARAQRTRRRISPCGRSFGRSIPIRQEGH